ncbi:MAG: septum site-determining protein MinD [Bacteroides sp.]|nr:septum site-determining protein MinD [Bacillota bacterium]MCM1393589.1 septum site-determining protein MinD [[Eubacterium] siraeum]MCM1454992.1 septum site-determining protein MinD [Bacteroides sp.]
MRKIVVTSGKGGVGKTTVTATLGRKLARSGYRVVLVDGDVGLNNLDVVTAIERRVVYDMSDVLLGKCRAFQALVADTESPMRILPSSKDSALLTAQAFRGIVDGFSDFDFVIIDCPAGIEHGFHRAISSADEALIVTTPSASAIRDADKVIGLLGGYRLADVSLVVNRVRADMVVRGEMIGASEIGSLLHTPVVGVIPEDDMITLYQQLGGLACDTVSDRAYDVLANNVACRTKNFVDVSFRRRLFRRRY